MEGGLDFWRLTNELIDHVEDVYDSTVPNLDAFTADLFASLGEHPISRTIGATIEEFRRNFEVMIEQARSMRQVFVGHAEALVDVAEPMYPQRHHLFAMANRFCVDHCNNIEQFATWALEQSATWPDPLSPSETHRSQTRATLEKVLERSRELPA